MEEKEKIGLSVGLSIVGILSVIGLYKYYTYLKERQLKAEKEDLEVSSIYSRRNKTGFKVISTQGDGGRGVRKKGHLRMSVNV